MSNESGFDRCPGEFVGIFSRYSFRIYGYIRTLVPNYQDSNDVFQNTSCVLWKKYPEYRQGSDFFAWACSIARYEILAHYRRQKKQRLFSEVVLDKLSTEIVSRSHELDRRAEALTQCLENLPVEDRDLVDNKYRKNRRVIDIAKDLSKSLASVYRSLSRIHDRLFQCVERTLSEG